MIQFGCGEYTVCGSVGALPATYASMVRHAKLHDDLGVRGPEGTALVVTVATTSTGWPALVVAQRFDPGPEAGFHPGVLLIPEAAVLFVGAGTRLLGYDLRTPRRLWEDEADTGFWGWRRHGDLVIMSAELELAAWAVSGEKRWTTFVEPPWSYDVRDGKMELDVMGKKSTFPVGAGPDARGAR
jgi:hypothetical protein